MAKLPTDNHQETSSYTNMWNGFEDEDYRAFLDLQLDCGEADMDPMYKIFLEHLRKDGHSYILEIADDHHGLSAYVKYEDESESSEEIDVELQTSSKNNSYKNERKRNGARKFSHAKGGPSEEPVEISVPLDSESMFGSACSLVDETYQLFLRHVRFEDDSMILDWESRTVRYEEVNEASNLSEALTTEDTLCNSGQGLVPYGSSHCVSDVAKVDDVPIVTCKFSDPSQFTNQLNADLARPFDQNEYEQLWKEVTDRKPLEKQKELRSKSISYATDQVGMSYLDRHSDLAKQLKSADCQKKLELLRGFFFWLKNLCHEGAFMPWSIIPSTSDTLLSSGYEVVLSLNHQGEDVQGQLPSISSVEDVLG